MAKKREAKQNGLSIEKTINGIQEKFGVGSIMMLDQAAMDVESIPSGSFGLDIALGIGGYPKGRIVEIFGPESSGKTTLALHAVVETQKTGGLCAYIDTENALDPKYAQSLGVNAKVLAISQPDNGEQAFQIVESMVRSGQFSLIVIDSVASLVPKSEIEGEIGDANVGRHAKLMASGLRTLVPLANKSGTIILFINQIRMIIGGMPNAPTETTTGGKALKFYSSVRIDIRRIAQIKKGDEVVGGRTRIKVVKNKVAPPFRQVEVDLIYGEGISKQGELLAMGEKLNIIQKSGSSYKYKNESIGRGYDAARKHLKANPELSDEIEILIRKAMEDTEQKPAEVDDNSTVGEE